MTWEYRVISSESLHESAVDGIAELNRHGNEGWELVTVLSRDTYDEFIFKRLVMTELSVEVNMMDTSSALAILREAGYG